MSFVQRSVPQEPERAPAKAARHVPAPTASPPAAPPSEPPAIVAHIDGMPYTEAMLARRAARMEWWGRVA